MMKKILGFIGIGFYLGLATQSFALDLEWKTKTPMPTGRGGLAAVVLNGKIYAIGGYINRNVVEEFDPSIGPYGTWTTKVPMPTGRSDLADDTLNGKIYAIGGYGGSNVVEEFDPSIGPNGTWTTKAAMPTAQGGLAAVALNGKIYAM